MKKIAIRKLNRTQLKKDATKEVYITGKILLDFFGYHNINELATSRRDEKAKKRFFYNTSFCRQFPRDASSLTDDEKRQFSDMFASNYGFRPENIENNN